MPEATASQSDQFRSRPFTPREIKVTVPKQDVIQWRPLAGASSLPFTGTDYAAVRKALIGMWGTFPIRLSKANGDHESMKAMMFAAGAGQEPFHILHQALMQYGDIELQDL